MQLLGGGLAVAPNKSEKGKVSAASGEGGKKRPREDDGDGDSAYPDGSPDEELDELLDQAEKAKKDPLCIRS